MLAEPARALVDLPPFASSAMDGFALRSVDTPGRLPVVARIAAGSPARARAASGRGDGHRDRWRRARGRRRGGPDRACCLNRRQRRGSRSPLAKVTTCGRAVATRAKATSCSKPGRGSEPRRSARSPPPASPELVCARRPRVAVLATGSELRTPGESLEPGEIYEANGAMLEAALRAHGADVERLAPVRGRRGRASRRARRARLESDVVVSSGGVSVGPHDLVRSVARGARCRRGLLARRGQARQADLVRRARRDARVRASRQSRLDARRVRALRPTGAARARGGARPGPALPAGAARSAGASERRARRARPRALAATVRSSRSAARSRT